MNDLVSEKKGVTRPDANSRIKKTQIDKARDEEIKEESHKHKIEISKIVHKLKITTLRNIYWIAPLIAVVIIGIAVDVCTILWHWKNPSILFNQVKALALFSFNALIGGVIEYFRNKLVNNNQDK